MFYAVSRLGIHTDAQVLHMGALLEFRKRLRELVAAGEHHEAALLWGSVLEIQHYPPPPPGLIEGLPPGVPAVRTIPCSEVGCQRCLQRPWGLSLPVCRNLSLAALWWWPPVCLRPKRGMISTAMRNLGFRPRMSSTWLQVCSRPTCSLTISMRCCAMWNRRPIHGSELGPALGGMAAGPAAVEGARVVWAWSPGWRCFLRPALAVGARQFCSVDGVPAAIAGARRLEIGGALVAAALGAGRQAVSGASWPLGGR